MATFSFLRGPVVDDAPPDQTPYLVRQLVSRTDRLVAPQVGAIATRAWVDAVVQNPAPPAVAFRAWVDAVVPNPPVVAFRAWVDVVVQNLPVVHSMVQLPLAPYLTNNSGHLAINSDGLYPTSSIGLPPGAVWNNGGVVAVVPGEVPDPLAQPLIWPGIGPAELASVTGGNLPLSPGMVVGQLWNSGGLVAITPQTAEPPGMGLGLQPYDYARTIISQYANSPGIWSLIESFDAAVDPYALLNAFFDNIWNVDTAQGYGLDVWGRIVGVSRVLQVPSGKFFGFAEAADNTYEVPFNQGPFYNGWQSTSNYMLTDTAFLTLILAKAMFNISNGSIASTNAILMELFGASGQCWCTDGGQQASPPFFGFAEAADSTNETPFNQAPFYLGAATGAMTMSYVFNFTPTPVQTAIINNSGVLPRPAGVSASVVIL